VVTKRDSQGETIGSPALNESEGSEAIHDLESEVGKHKHPKQQRSRPSGQVSLDQQAVNCSQQ